MEAVFNTFDINLSIRVISAVLLGFAIGMEREMTNKYAGLRTNILVCVGACVFTILSIYGFSYVSNPDVTNLSYDTSRVGAQIASGIGFIGGGTVLKHGATVQGLTTAATLWISAAIGMACGAGMYPLAIVATILSVVVLVSVRMFERNILTNSIKNKKRVKVKLDCISDSVKEAYDYIVDNYRDIIELNKKQSSKNDGCTTITFTADIIGRRPVKYIYKDFEKISGIESISIQEPDELV